MSRGAVLGIGDILGAAGPHAGVAVLALREIGARASIFFTARKPELEACPVTQTVALSTVHDAAVDFAHGYTKTYARMITP